MPWYRSDDGQTVYHACIRGRNGAPAACRALRFDSDNPEHGEECGRMGGKLCDAPTSSGGSCDMSICQRHATHVEGKDLDYCPTHRHLAKGRPR